MILNMVRSSQNKSFSIKIEVKHIFVVTAKLIFNIYYKYQIAILHIKTFKAILMSQDNFRFYQHGGLLVHPRLCFFVSSLRTTDLNSNTYFQLCFSKNIDFSYLNPENCWPFNPVTVRSLKCSTGSDFSESFISNFGITSGSNRLIL